MSIRDGLVLVPTVDDLPLEFDEDDDFDFDFIYDLHNEDDPEVPDDIDGEDDWEWFIKDDDDEAAEPDTVRIVRAFLADKVLPKVASGRIRAKAADLNKVRYKLRAALKHEPSYDGMFYFARVGEKLDDRGAVLRAVDCGLAEAIDLIVLLLDEDIGGGQPFLLNENLRNAVLKTAFTELETLIEDWDREVGR